MPVADFIRRACDGFFGVGNGGGEVSGWTGAGEGKGEVEVRRGGGIEGEGLLEFGEGQGEVVGSGGRFVFYDNMCKL